MESNSDPCLNQLLKGHKKQVTGLKFHPNEKELASSGEDGKIMMWNLKSKDVRCYQYAAHSETVTDLDFTANGKLLASCSFDRTIRLWVPTLQGASTEIKAHTGPVQSIEFSPDGLQMCSGSNDKSVKLWDVSRCKFISSYAEHNNWVYCARFAPDGRSLVTCADDKSIKFWDVNQKASIHTIKLPKGSATKLAVHSGNNSVAAAMKTGSVRVYDIRTQKLVQHYVLHDKTTCVSWHPGGKHFITAGNDGKVCIVDAMEARPIYTVEGENGPITSVTFNENGDYFSCGGAKKCVMVWKTNFDPSMRPGEVSACSSSSSFFN